MKRTPSQHERALLSLIQGESADLIRHSNTVYQWGKLYMEILTYEQMMGRRVPASWYSPLQFEGVEWRVREMGKQAKQVQRIKKK